MAPTGDGEFENALAGMSPQEIDARSIAELDAGRLPLRAQQRLATMRADAAFTSDLSVDEHHAIRSVGFSPVGQVMGSCVVHPGAYGFGPCGYYGGGMGSGYGGGYGRGFGWGQAPVAVASQIEQALHKARVRAIDRLTQECEGLGGDGVVGVDLTMGPFIGGGLEIQAIGTAVRADGNVRPPRPFTSDLTGQDFAKLLISGWLPVGLVMGTAVLIRHDDYTTAWQTGSWNNTEITGLVQLVTDSRDRARGTMQSDGGRLGAQQIVLRDISLRIFEQECRSGGEGRDHVVQAVTVGTAIVALRHGHHSEIPSPLPMIRLNK
jgi:uncharacterized protein YbjQ (UPF0145 family)